MIVNFFKRAYEGVFNYAGKLFPRAFKTREGNPKVICIHHTADDDDAHSNVESLFAEWVRRGEGYNFIIDADGGVLHADETLPENAISNGVYGYNPETWNISVDGNFEIHHPDPKEVEGLIQVIATKAKKWGWRKGDVWRITYHQEIGLKYARAKYVTACPGKNLISQIPYIRERVAAYLPK